LLLSILTGEELDPELINRDSDLYQSVRTLKMATVPAYQGAALRANRAAYETIVRAWIAQREPLR